MIVLRHFTSSALLAAWLTSSLSVATRPSPGCKNPEDKVADTGLVKHEVHVADFEDVVRTYWTHASPRATEPAPLLLGFHGQTEDAADFASWHNYSLLGKHSNLMTVFPQGMNDSYPGEEQGTGWNVGSGADNATCLLQGPIASEYGCYKSCRKLKRCGRCNWSTCYDDVLFVKTIIKEVAQKFCIDLDRVYAQGESNGAMLVQHLVRELPDTFAGVATWFGTPMLGYLLGSHLSVADEQLPLAQTAILALHGRNDVTIPPGGGVSEDGWIYEPLEQSMGVWAELHHCKRKATPLDTQWDGGPLNFRCAEYRSCTTGRRIMQCMYDGVHGDWPSGISGDEITLWFLLQFHRGKPAHDFISLV